MVDSRLPTCGVSPRFRLCPCGRPETSEAPAALKPELPGANVALRNVRAVLGLQQE